MLVLKERDRDGHEAQAWVLVLLLTHSVTSLALCFPTCYRGTWTQRSLHGPSHSDILWDGEWGSENVLCGQRPGFRSLCHLLGALERDLTSLSPSVKWAGNGTYFGRAIP